MRPLLALPAAHLRRIGINFLGFQATWFACVAGAGAGYPLFGPLVAVLWLWLHLARLDGISSQAPRHARERTREVKLLVASACIGFLIDSALVLSGAMQFPEHVGLALPTTPWMLALWAAFASTLRHSMNWLRGRYVLGTAAGAVFGPLAYKAGEALNAISIGTSSFAWLGIACAWALAIPILLRIREFLEQYPENGKALGKQTQHPTG